MRENKPKVLDLEGIERKLLKDFKKVFEDMKKEMEWDINFEDFISSERMLKEDIEEIKSLEIDYEYSVLIGMLYMFKKLQQRIKQACEFYLRYKDKPELLLKEQRNLVGIPEGTEFYPPGLIHLKDKYKYNEWLFRLAFKDVFEGGGSHGEERS